MRIWGYNLPWEELNGKTILVAGATGLIGTCMIYAIVYRNKKYNSNIKVVALARNKELLEEKFSEFKNVESISADICKEINYEGIVDYIVHAACDVAKRTHEKYPVQAMDVFTEGTSNICKLAVKKNSKVILLSSVAIYGRSKTKVPFDEESIGYIDLSNSAYSYCEGKRTSEMICSCYSKQYDMNFSILRLEKAYGPTMNLWDRSILPYFIMMASSGEKITLKSDGKQEYNYVYVTDVVTAIFFMILKGERKAYNCGLSENEKVQCFGDIVRHVTEVNDVGLVFASQNANKSDNPGADFSAMYSDLLIDMGWKKKTMMEQGIKKTSDILKSVYGNRLRDYI